MCTIHKTSEKFLKQLRALRQMLPLLQLHWSNSSNHLVFLPPPKTSKGLGKTSDQRHGVEVAKGKEAAQDKTRLEAKGKGAGHGQEVSQAKPLSETKGPEADQGKEVVSKTKESKLFKPQAVVQEKKATSGKAVDLPVSQPDSKEDPPLTQT